MIEVRLRSLVSSGGDMVSLPRSGVTCIMGGNNVGKSQLLREIHQRVGRSGETLQGRVVDGLDIDKTPVDVDAAHAFLETFGVRQRAEQGLGAKYTAPNDGRQMSAQDFQMFYSSQADSVSVVAPFFVHYASAGSLLGVASGSIPGGMAEEFGGNPLNRFFRDGQLSEELSDLARESFGLPLTLDRINGNVMFRLGEVEIPVPPFDKPTLEYANAVAELEPLSEQGDGIKSFLGLAVTVLAGQAPILLIDEPEAFLHPSQARTLGRWLGRKAVDNDLQVVLSTHDRDLLLGLLESSGASSANLLRLTRNGRKNYLHQLPPQEVAAVWADPVLRYSNVLQGLFHRRTVICEADADCRFYGAVIDELAQETGTRAAADETLLVPSGGKARVAPMARALTSLGVETWAIVDFDMLRSRSDLRAVIDSLKQTWTDKMDSNYIAFATMVNQQDLWSVLKNVGLAGVPKGAAFEAARQLLDELAQAGILIVRVGEMEDHDKTIGSHGAKWVSAMLERDAHKTCAVARDLVQPLLGLPDAQEPAVT